jgi:ATP phosphoribosyltransferase regulatory subunit HisZ
MAELDASKLPGETLRELADFLGRKLSAKVEESSGKIVVENVSNTRLRKAVRWFLSRKDLSGEYRVLSDGKAKTLAIRKIKKD